MEFDKEEVAKWSNEWLGRYGDRIECCTHCKKPISFDPYVKAIGGTGDSYCGCWCKRWWCSEECAKKDGWVFRGDAYETDHVSCNYCRK